MTQDNPRRLLRAAIGAVLVTSFAIGGAAKALEISQVQSIDESLTDWARPPLPLVVETSFNRFSVPGGTLTGVVRLNWDLQLALDVSIEFCNTFGGCEPSKIDWVLQGLGGAFGSGLLASTQWPYDFATDDDGPQDAQTTLTLIGGTDFTNLSDFLGADPIGKVENRSTTQADRLDYDTRRLTGTLTLIYTYEPAQAPVPGTLALLGIGLAGFGALRRRRAA